MKQRIITGFCAFAALLLMIWLGKWALFATVLIVHCACLYEYISTVSKERDTWTFVLILSLGSGMIASSVWFPGYEELFLIGGILLLFVKDILSATHNTEQTIYLIWGWFYISYILSLAIRILFSTNGIFLFVVTVLTCIACDTLAYFIGIKFGRHKLCPDISPKKSVEGSIAGFIGAVVVCVGAFFLSDVFHTVNLSFYFMLIAGISIGIMAQFGDLAASMIKRKFDVKDYSNILPGHGGFLDRVDSILFAIATMYILYRLF